MSGKTDCPDGVAILTAALHYLSLGWAVLPLSPGSKVLGAPEAKLLSGTGVATEQYWSMFYPTTSQDEVRRWFDIAPDLNIGIGMDASGLTVVDIDQPDLFFMWWRAGNHPDREGPKVYTPRGVHYYFAVQEGDETGTIHEPYTGHSVGDYLTGVMPPWKRSSPVYVVAPPSVIDGKKYYWADDEWTMQHPTVTAPEWIRQAVSVERAPASWWDDGGMEDYEDEYDRVPDCEVCGGEFWDGGTSCTCGPWMKSDYHRAYPAKTQRKSNGRLRARREVRDIQNQQARIPARDIPMLF